MIWLLLTAIGWWLVSRHYKGLANASQIRLEALEHYESALMWAELEELEMHDDER